MTKFAAPTIPERKSNPRNWKRAAAPEPAATGPSGAMTIPDVAKLLACSEKQVENFIADGEIQVFNIGRGKVRQSLRITSEAVTSFINRRMVKPSVRVTDPNGYEADYAAYLAKKAKR